MFDADITLDSLGGGEIEEIEEIEPPMASRSTGSTGATSSIEERALSLLGSGIKAEAVAAALGVTPARISQLLSDETFAGKVATLRYTALQAHNVRDSAYDEVEDQLLLKLKSSLPLMIKPETILRAIHTVNNAKRRGQSSPEQVVNQQNIVALVLPTQITEKFATNINNQVTQAGTQDLLTIPSGTLLKQTETIQRGRLEESNEVVSNETPIEEFNL